MSKIFENSHYAVMKLRHRLTGCFHLTVTALSPVKYKPEQAICYFNDFAKRTHKINNFALREFVLNHPDLHIQDFSVTTVIFAVSHAEAKAAARIHALERGVDKLLTAHIVGPAEWELNRLAKGRIQEGLPSPYVKPPVTRKRVRNPETLDSLSKGNSPSIRSIPRHLRVEIIREASQRFRADYMERCWIKKDDEGFTGWRWEKTKATPVIVCAANKYGDFIVPGTRHYSHTMNAVIDLVGLDALHEYAGVDGYDQGFIDQYGTYHDRKTAMRMCKEQGRVLKDGGSDTILFSEHLY